MVLTEPCAVICVLKKVVALKFCFVLEDGHDMNNDNHGHRLTGKLKPSSGLNHGIIFFV